MPLRSLSLARMSHSFCHSGQSNHDFQIQISFSFQTPSATSRRIASKIAIDMPDSCVASDQDALHEKY
ncbi:unnamed protein product [Cercospora beticola]|nr:unnamed protein product [Cercospora beticola]